MQNNPDYIAFSSKYQPQEMEILLLTNDESGGAAKFKSSWASIQFFLGYVNLSNGVLMEGGGHLNWLLTNEEHDNYGFYWPYNFEIGTIYRLKVRALKDEHKSVDKTASYNNSLLLVSVEDQDCSHPELERLLAEYRKPITIESEMFGTFLLQKDYAQFEGNIDWLGKMVNVYLEVELEDAATWDMALDNLKKLCADMQSQNQQFINFAAKELTELANDWAVGDAAEITEADFKRKIFLSELVVNSNGSFTAYYNDGDLFAGHVIDVSGSIEHGVEYADIAG